MAGESFSCAGRHLTPLFRLTRISENWPGQTRQATRSKASRQAKTRATNGPALGLVPGLDRTPDLSQPVGQSLRADDCGVFAPAQDPPFGFVDAIQTQAQP